MSRFAAGMHIVMTMCLTAGRFTRWTGGMVPKAMFCGANT